MNVLYIFRNSKAGFSITKVIGTIARKVGEFYLTGHIFLPHAGARILDIAKNMVFVRKSVKTEVIFHVSGDAHYLAYVLPKEKTIITVHDIMYYSYLTGFKKIVWKYLYIYPLKRANQLVFISEFARKQVEEVININVSNTTVIPNALDDGFIYSPKPFNSEKPIILHIGTLERKNLSRSIQALENISCHLRIVGKIDTKIIALLNQYDIEYSQVENLSDKEIIEEYRNCDFVNFPSMYEGFGMPIIEGQAMGRSIVTSNLSPMKEVAGENAAYLVDPYNLEDLKKTYLEVITNSVLREERIERGLLNSSKYHVDSIVQQYISVYKKMM